MLNLVTSHGDDLTYLKAQSENVDLWHRRLGHVSSSLLNKLVSKDLVLGLPKLNFCKSKICEACVKGKQIRTSFKSKKQVTSSRVLELLHMDLCGPLKVQSRNGKEYILVIVDDHSKFIWTRFLRSKQKHQMNYSVFQNDSNKIESSDSWIRYDRGTEFENSKIDQFSQKNGINHNLSAPRTPQQNWVVNFWAEAVNTSCHVTNRCLIRSLLNKTPYELLNNKKPTFNYLRTFGCKCFVLNNDKDDLGKFDPRSYEGVFVGYFSSSKAYRVFNEIAQWIEESVHVVFDRDGNLKRISSNDEDI